MPAQLIRTQSREACAVCGLEGDYLYLDQSDRMFESPGQWNLKRCRNPTCKLVWLDPMPLAEDIAMAYARYYTHAAAASAAVAGGTLRRWMQRLKRGHLARHYNYKQPEAPARGPWAGWLLGLFPLRRLEAEGEVRFLPALPQGRLLDVGCGSGEWLLNMQRLGWQVTGVDFDPVAVAVGRRQGLHIGLGALESQHFADESFDAVTLNQVIEHVPDPLSTLRECARILRPGGRLFVSTPNVSSLSHRLFGARWRGLEPPRHLHLFSFGALGQALQAAGMRRIDVLPLVADSIVYESYLLNRGWRGSFVGAKRHWSAWLFARLFAVTELLLVKGRPTLADCVMAMAIK